MSPLIQNQSESTMTITNHQGGSINEGCDPHSDPVGCTWRGDALGEIMLETIPNFGDNLLGKRQWIKEHMAGAFRYWGKLGFGEGASGHITVRDPVLPGHYWMNPLGVHFSSMKVSKLVLVDPNGHVSPDGAQLPINGPGFFIHSAIHKARPEVQAIGHCHPTHGKAWSVFGKPIDILTQDACAFYENLSVYDSFGGIVLAPEEGNRIVNALGPKHKAVILQNHGLLTLGTTVDEMAYLLALLDRECHIQLLTNAALSASKPPDTDHRTFVSPEDAAFTAATTQHPENLYIDFKPEYDLLIEETNGAFLK